MPTGGSAKSRKAGAGKQAQGPRPVVPAIPLPHVKRQAAAAAAAAAAASVPASSPPPAAGKQETNGAPATKNVVEEEVSPVLEQQGGAVTDVESAASPAAQANEPAGRAPAEPAGNPKTPTVNVPKPATPTATTAATADDPAQQPARPADSETAAKSNGVATAGAQPKHKPAAERSSVDLAKPRIPPSMSPARYQMPPPFQPTGRPLGMMPNGEMARGPRPMPNGAPHPHQAHPSNGSVHFGAFHDSPSSSPAPPHSGGIAPPPGMQAPDGRQPYMGPAGNGFPPMMPYGAEMMPVSNFDSFGRPAMAFAPMESYPHYGNALGPSTPHSFHGSQSSAHPEENGMYNQFPPGGPRNNIAGPGDDVQTQNHQGRVYGAPDYSRMMPNPGMPPQMMPQNDDADGIIGYFRQQFGAPELSDCTLELRYLDDRAPPVRIPGHRVVLARSPRLSNLLRGQALQPGPSDQSSQIILLETNSKWIRSDAFYMATQRLYGAPLLPIPPPRSMEAGDMTSAGSTAERLNFALSYAAAGHLLQWSSLVRRGCEVATHTLDWQTMEKAMEFALDGYTDNGIHESYKYGEGSKVLLHAVVTFIVHNLPPSLAIDTSTPEPEDYARLPGYAPPPEPPAETTPPIARGSSVQLGKGRRSRKLSTIQFGDLSVSDGRNDAVSETPRASQSAHPISHAMLSRILLNLPFGQLKMVLESSGSGNVSGWANTESRYRIIKDVVEERENRRVRAVEAVTSGRVQDAEAIRVCLRSPEPRSCGQWTVLGWQEEMLPYGSNPDGPSLGRKWAPMMDAVNGPAAAYP